MGKFIKNTINNIHQIEEIAPNTYRIDEAGVCNAYLLIGDKKALLIDSGNGISNIYLVASSLTSLPIEMVATHMHPDHVGGRNWFKYYYVSEKDNTIEYKALCIKKANELLIKMRKDLNLKDVGISKKVYHARAIGITADKVFDLGNRSIKIVEAPGHTRGSIVLLDDKNKLMFTGDSVNNWMWLQVPGGLDLSTWLTTVDKLIKLSDTYTAYCGHGDGIIRKEDFLALKKLGEELLKVDKSRLHAKRGNINYPEDNKMDGYHIYIKKNHII
jgi:hydroxyacylglutathione hydrolase